MGTLLYGSSASPKDNASQRGLKSEVSPFATQPLPMEQAFSFRDPHLVTRTMSIFACQFFSPILPLIYKKSKEQSQGRIGGFFLLLLLLMHSTGFYNLGPLLCLRISEAGKEGSLFVCWAVSSPDDSGHGVCQRPPSLSPSPPRQPNQGSTGAAHVLHPSALALRLSYRLGPSHLLGPGHHWSDNDPCLGPREDHPNLLINADVNNRCVQ